jgi:hypothetical protein
MQGQHSVWQLEVRAPTISAATAQAAAQVKVRFFVCVSIFAEFVDIAVSLMSLHMSSGCKAHSLASVRPLYSLLRCFRHPFAVLPLHLSSSSATHDHRLPTTHAPTNAFRLKQPISSGWTQSEPHTLITFDAP